ncbi:MAG: RNA ligase family protein, partial [Paraclostridium sp.]
MSESMFVKYPHLERFGTSEVQGIEEGECYIFPKLDGTNASAWFENGIVQGGSRKRHLSLDFDNAGFYFWLTRKENIETFFNDYPNLRLFGEYLVPHTVKTYRDDAWRKFYVFDVYDNDTNRFLHYNEYKDLLEEYKI